MEQTEYRPEPFLYENKNAQVGVLLIHGFTGTTAELKGLGQHLYEQGFTVHAPLLKGHGVTPEEMECTTWVDWWVSAREGYETLKRVGCEHIFVVGLSMGGLLALKIAQYQEMKGIVTLCSPVKVRDKRMKIVPYIKYVLPYTKRKTKREQHIEDELYVYDKTPLACIQSLDHLIHNVSNALAIIRSPILIVQAEKDETVDPFSGQLLYEGIGSKDKRLSYYKNSGHIITLDQEKEDLFQEIQQFIEEHLRQ